MPAIHTQKIPPYLVEFDSTYEHNKSLDFTRSPGLHVSTIYTDYCVASGLLKTWDDDADDTGEAEWLLHLGLAFEGYMAPRTNVLSQENYNRVWQPGELSVKLSNGNPVYMTPDFYSCNSQWHVWKTQGEEFPVVEDFKFTMKRPFDKDAFPESWLMQAACYLYAYDKTMNISGGHTRFRYWVLHSKGDYKKKTSDAESSGTTLPICNLYSLDYTHKPEEITSTWEKLDKYACRNYDRLLVKQHEAHEKRTQLREQRKQAMRVENEKVRNAYMKSFSK